MCQFHQVAIIGRYNTENPELPASIELKELMAMMKKRTDNFFNLSST